MVVPPSLKMTSAPSASSIISPAESNVMSPEFVFTVLTFTEPPDKSKSTKASTTAAPEPAPSK